MQRNSRLKPFLKKPIRQMSSLGFSKLWIELGTTSPCVCGQNSTLTVENYSMFWKKLSAKTTQLRDHKEAFGLFRCPLGSSPKWAWKRESNRPRRSSWPEAVCLKTTSPLVRNETQPHQFQTLLQGHFFGLKMLQHHPQFVKSSIYQGLWRERRFEWQLER